MEIQGSFFHYSHFVRLLCYQEN